MRNLAVLLLAGCSRASAAPTAKEVAKESDIVTDKMEAMNSPKGQKPATKFNKGSVAPIKPPKATKTKTGFEVKFPSGATITTPTVYGNEVIVSGGFRSNELYAYEAHTGKTLWCIDLHDD